MANQNILKEYLVSLGFRVNQTESRQFTKTISTLDKSVGNLGKGLIGVGIGAATMATLFASNMEKVFYASKLMGTSVSNLQAFQFAAKQVGVSGDAMSAAIAGVARTLRSNPGYYGVLNQLGVSTKGKDNAEITLDLIKHLAKMPDYQGQGFASEFGIDPDTFYLLKQSIPEFEKALKLRKEMAAAAGVDPDEVARIAQEYTKMFQQITEQAGLLQDVLMKALLQPMTWAAQQARQMLTDLTKIAKGDPWEETKKFVEGGIRGGNPAGPEMSAEGKKRGWKTVNPRGANAAAAGITDDSDSGLGILGDKLFDAIDWNWQLNKYDPNSTSSILARKKRSAAAAKATTPAPSSGIDWNKVGGTAESRAVAQGFLEGMAPRDPATDLDYINKVLQGTKLSPAHRKALEDQRDALADQLTTDGRPLGVSSAFSVTPSSSGAGGGGISQTNTITVNGAGSPQQTADAVEEKLRVVNGDLVRNMRPKVQ